MNICFKQPDIKFYFSFQCPYSFIAWELLNKLLCNSRVSLMPIEIGLFPSGTTKFHFRELWAEPRWNRLIADAKSVGLSIYKPEKYVSSLNAARAIEKYGPANASDYITSVFKGFFQKRIDISLPTSLKMYLQSEGIDSGVLSSAIEDEKTEKKALENQLLWGHDRIRMVPTIELDGERYSGFVDLQSLERFLRSVID